MQLDLLNLEFVLRRNGFHFAEWLEEGAMDHECICHVGIPTHIPSLKHGKRCPGHIWVIR